MFLIFFAFIFPPSQFIHKSFTNSLLIIIILHLILFSQSVILYIVNGNTVPLHHKPQGVRLHTEEPNI